MSTLLNTAGASTGAERPRPYYVREPTENEEIEGHFARAFRHMSPREIACAAVVLGAAWQKTHGWRRVIVSTDVLMLQDCHVNTEIVQQAGGKFSKDKSTILIPFPWNGNDVDILTAFIERLLDITKSRRAAAVMGDVG